MCWTSRTSTDGTDKTGKGQLCRVLARGNMNSCLVEFPDGYRMVTSSNAVGKAGWFGFGQHTEGS
jgi:hypothetical protein